MFRTLMFIMLVLVSWESLAELPPVHTQALQQVPVTMATRKAMAGPGFVAIFRTTLPVFINVGVVVHSARLGTTKRFVVQLTPGKATELGWKQGAALEFGDTLTVEEEHYAPITFTENQAVPHHHRHHHHKVGPVIEVQ